MQKRARRWWAVVILASLFAALAMGVRASTTAPPPARQFYKRLLADDTKFTAYPDMAVGEGGLVVSVWTQGPGSVIDRHLGPVILSWISDSAEGWKTIQVDATSATEAVVAVAGTTAHVVWIKESDPWPTQIYYNSCDLSQAVASCTPRELVAQGGSEGGATSKVSQIHVALDQAGTLHLVWSEGDLRGLYYSYKSTGQGWADKSLVSDDDAFDTFGHVNDFPTLAINHVGDKDYVHLVWAEERSTLDSTYHIAKYCRREAIGGSWDDCIVLYDVVFNNIYYTARNLSIAADGEGNVYVVWDTLVDHTSRRKYVIGYRHSPNNGLSWRDIGTYRQGSRIGSLAEEFSSGEDASIPAPTTGEYAHFLRPRISLATSGTLTTPVPVLTWHAQILPRGSAPERVRASDEPIHKIFWTYASKPGSTNFGGLYWASDPITLSVDFCGELELNVNSATAELAIVGDLNNVKDGGQSAGPDRLHAVFHEEVGQEVWGVYYTGYVTVSCFKVYLPLALQSYTSGGGR